jgi:hypothetical protein
VPESYLGLWNYDQPDAATMTNIAVVGCPPGTASCAGTPKIELPQIGYVVFSAGPGNTVIGRTDQGCTWRFALVPGGLALSPATQYCFNHVVDSGYTITKWSVTFSGAHEKETIIAISHLPTGNYDFLLQDGRRTRPADQPADFAGSWRYDPADPDTGLNIELVSHPAQHGQAKIVRTPVTGQVFITAGHDGLITAKTSDGCRWTLLARGNTAELDPARQTCAATTLTFWAIASDGHHQDSIMTGIAPGGAFFLLSDGGLTRTQAGGHG